MPFTSLLLLAAIGLFAFGYKARSMILAALAGLAAMLTVYVSHVAPTNMTFNESVSELLTPPMLVLMGIFIAVSVILNVLAVWMFKKVTTDDITKKADVSVVIGRVLDSSHQSLAFSESDIHRNAFGNLAVSTNHFVETTHDTWLRNLETGLDQKFSGHGKFNARKDHVVAIVRWTGGILRKSNHLFTLNLSTGSVESESNTISHAQLFIYALGLAAFGIVALPLGFLFCLLNACGLTRSSITYWPGAAAPGSNKIEALMSVLGMAAYALGLGFFFNAYLPIPWPAAFFLVMTPIFSVMLYMTARAKNIRHKALCTHAMEQVMLRHQAIKRNAAAVAA